jgi:hypothetical protein
VGRQNGILVTGNENEIYGHFTCDDEAESKSPSSRLWVKSRHTGWQIAVRHKDFVTANEA